MKNCNPLLVFFILISLIVLSVEWEWSLVDDWGLFDALKTEQERLGYFAGIIKNITRSATQDYDWGLFRPSYWIYISTFYLLPIKLAFLTRFIEIFTIIAISSSFISRIGNHKPSSPFYYFALFCFAANRALYDGLSFPSQQETTGLFFCILSIPFLYSNSFSRVFLGFLFIAIAVGFKLPFIWLGFSVSIYFLLRAKKIKSNKFLILSLSFLAVFSSWMFIGLIWAKHGSYSSQISKPDLDRVIFFTKGLITQYGPPLFILSSIFVLFKNKKLNFSFNLGTSIGLGGLVYLLNLAPWGARGYILGPPLHLISFGILSIFSISSLSNVKNSVKSKLRHLLILSSAILALTVSMHGVVNSFARNQTICRLRDHLIEIQRLAATIATNGPESSSRLGTMMKHRTNGKSALLFKYISQDATFNDLEEYPHLYITFDDQAFTNNLLKTYKIHHKYSKAVSYEVRNLACHIIPYNLNQCFLNQSN